MKYCEEDIVIPNWISERSYFVGKDCSRTYISNEKKHTYVQLDGLSSDFWFYLYHHSYEQFVDWMKKNNLQKDADSFIEQLATQGLLILKGCDFGTVDSISYQDDVSLNDNKSNFVSERNKWLAENHFLNGLFFELTYKCNLKCVHCYNPKDLSTVEIPIEKAKKAIDDAYELGCYSVTVSGGESTLYSQFNELIDYIRMKRLSLEIFTNGQALLDNPKVYEHIKSIYPHRVCLSLYSVDKKDHEQVTDVVGSYEKTVSAIRKLREDGINVQIKNFLLNINCDGCVKVKNFAEEIKADCVADLSLIPTIQGDKKTFKYVVDENKLFDLFINSESPLYIGTNPPLFDIEENKDTTPCLGGIGSLCITPTMDVNICVSMPMSVGNLKETSIKDIWMDAIHHKEDSKLYKWQSVTNSDLTECYKEDYCKFCHYCAGMGLLENGYLKKSDILCTQAKVKQRAYYYLNGIE